MESYALPFPGCRCAFRKFAEIRACAVLRTATSEACPKAMQAAIDGGFKIVEFTLRYVVSVILFVSLANDPLKEANAIVFLFLVRLDFICMKFLLEEIGPARILELTLFFCICI